MLLKYISRFVLKLIGWSSINDQLLLTLQQHPKFVCVFSHSSYFDFCIMVLYKLAYPQYLNNMKTLINAYYFTIMGTFLQYVGGIPSSVDDKGGSVNRISDVLNQQQSFLFLISPKGSILRKEWKSGYYYISKQLNIPIVAIGLDYETKSVKMGSIITTSDNEEDHIKNILYTDLSQIVPLHPNQENMTIRHHNIYDVTVISPLRLIVLVTCLFTPFMYYKFL
jgi:1-acyl-sn-glycerol-3-phosphate acyltransferase